MTDSLIFIQITKTEEGSFEKPLLANIKKTVPSLVTFDFDSFSEESTRQYAVDLIKQSRSATVVIEATTDDGPYTGLVGFLNKVQQLKHPQLLLVRKGELPPQLDKMMKVIGGRNFKVVSTTKEAEDLVVRFLENP